MFRIKILRVYDIIKRNEILTSRLFPRLMEYRNSDFTGLDIPRGGCPGCGLRSRIPTNTRREMRTIAEEKKKKGKIKQK